MTDVLYTNARFYSAADPRATAMLVRDGSIAWLGDGGDAPSAGRTVDLDGGLVTPAFVDAHVHATDTGLAADVTMLIGNGYVPGHAAFAVDVVRRVPVVRALFEARLAGH